MTVNRSGKPGLAGDRRGAVAIIFALVAPVLVGFAALGVEVGLWYMTQAHMQEVADAAAEAGVRELAAGTGMTSQAVALSGTLNSCTAANNCTLGTPTTFTSGSAQSANGVEVTAKTTVNFLLSGLVMPTNDNGTITISATGKAVYTPGATEDTGGVVGCVLGLDNNAAYTVALENSARIGCGTMSNSKCSGPNSANCTLDKTTYGLASYSADDPQNGAGLSTTTLSSMLLQNSAQITSTAAAAGLITLINSATVTTRIPNATQVGDPYAAVTVPASVAAPVTAPTATTTVTPTGSGTSGKPYVYSVPANTCANAITVQNSSYATFNPGCYKGLTVQNSSQATLAPGTYFINGLNIANSSTITLGNGTYYITGTGLAVRSCASGSQNSATLGAGTYYINGLNIGNSCNATLAAGSYYLAGLSIGNSSKATLGAGTYYVTTQLILNNSAQVTATSGSTLVLVGTGSNSFGLNLQNSAKLTIVAPGPTSGQPYPGIALLGDPGAAATTQEIFANSATLNIAGAAYFRTGIVDITNSAKINTATGYGTCTQIIGRRVLVGDSGAVNLAATGCSGVGTTAFMAGQQVTSQPPSVTLSQ